MKTNGRRRKYRLWTKMRRGREEDNIRGEKEIISIVEDEGYSLILKLITLISTYGVQDL